MVTRDLSDQRFHLDEVDFSDEHWSHNRKVLLKINRLEFIEILKQIQWSKIIKDSSTTENKSDQIPYADQILCGFLNEFLTSLTRTAQVVPSKPTDVTILTPIYSAKVVIDLM